MDTRREENVNMGLALTSPVFNENEVARHLGLKDLSGVTKVTVNEGNELYNALVSILGKSVSSNVEFEATDNKTGSVYNFGDGRAMPETNDKSDIKCNLGIGTHKLLFETQEIFVVLQAFGYPVGTNCGPKLYKTALLCMRESDKLSTILKFCNTIIKEHRKTPRESITIYRWHSRYEHWMKEQMIVARSIESVILPKSDKDCIVNDLSEFTSQEVAQFYKQHGIPYKRSYLFYGVPGAGKTSLIQAIAGKYQRDIYIINPTDREISDASLKYSFTKASNKRSLIILEDIDALFSKDRQTLVRGSSLTFSGLLNALDGVGSGNGVILILTTNHKERLDPALIRSGRVDIELKFNHATYEQIEACFRSFYNNGITDNSKYASEFATNLSGLLRKHNKHVTMAQLQNFFVIHRKDNAQNAAYDYNSILQLVKSKEEEEQQDTFMSKEEEDLVKELLWTLVNNHVFFQHPDLIRILKIHENVIAIMMNSIARSSQDESEEESAETPGGESEENVVAQQESSGSHEMVVACCRFLCYFCRTSRQNQKAMFDHLIFILENSNILLSKPSLRGSTPLDVAYSSLMENNELALALREHYLEKIAVYLSRCGMSGNTELVAKGYPDLGWDPVEGERFLDFLRFCVWVNGESVEENANLVIRLLIRRPECLGPALRGEGEGLLSAVMSGNVMSEQIQAQINTGRQIPELGFI